MLRSLVRSWLQVQAVRKPYKASLVVPEVGEGGVR